MTLALELFDVVADPNEQKDLAASEPKRVERMRAALDAWVESCKKSAAGADYAAPKKR